MAKSKSWPHLSRASDLALPLSGRPAAVDATIVVAPRGLYVAVFDALPPADENERDDKDALRVRVFSHDGRTFTEVLVHTPARTGYRFGDARLGKAAVSDAGVVAFAVGDRIHVVRPDGAASQIEAPGAWPFFDPLAPERLRLVVYRDGGEMITTHDTNTNTLVDTLRIGNSGNLPPQADPATGDVLLYDGWYAREGGAFVPSRGSGGPGHVLRVGQGTLYLGQDVEQPDATQRRGRDGAELPVPEVFQAWRRADVWRARNPMLASVDGRWVLGRYTGKNTLFDAEHLAPEELPVVPPQHTLIGPGIWALLDEHLAIASRFGLFLVDPRTGRPIGDGPVALLGLGLAGERVVTLHEDGVRVDGGAPIPVTPAVEPALDGLRISPRGRYAAVRCGNAGFPVVILDLAEGREVRRIEPAAFVAWIDEDRLAVHGSTGLRLLDVTTGAITALGDLPGSACLGSDGAGRFFVGTDTTLVERDASGAVLRTHTVPKKLKGYTWPSELVVHGSEVYALARCRIFRWDAAGNCERLNALENGIGGAKTDPKFSDGPLRSVAVSHDGRWLAVTAKTKSHALGVVLCNPEGTIAAWTGPIFGRRSVHGERAFCAFRGNTLVVGTEHGDVGVYTLPA
ncbi:SMP-30/gluconolactonase/LRE family protein [Polyangium sorediatum]|uniref:Uncharacterized protein n=1 Tax=Polyangium sorediatum TaxID=889274 RepID=A0ABT6NSV7_9BACT|nr:SMP-30/gluconolactonase/LRE family protein [Polyangium sorediatum]MDI1431425.1 hypothetical protein [Polyangium sorediatum]